MKKRLFILVSLAAMMVWASGPIHGESDLCLNLDMKPVLSLEQINQADLVDYLIQIDPNLEPPSGPEINSPEALYEAEVQMLIDNGYPASLADVEPDHLVTRRFFASVMFDIAVASDPEFAAKYGSVTDETERLQALVAEDWLYAEDGNLYREEILSVLCSKQPSAPEGLALDIVPEDPKDAELENPRSDF